MELIKIIALLIYFFPSLMQPEYYFDYEPANYRKGRIKTPVVSGCIPCTDHVINDFY